MSYTGNTPKFDSVEGENIKVDGNTISSTNENGDINLQPDGDGKVNVPTLPQGDSSNSAASTEYVDGAIINVTDSYVNYVTESLTPVIDTLSAQGSEITDLNNAVFVDNTFLKLDGTSQMQGDLDMFGNKITQLAAPTSDSDAVNKAYADNMSGGIVVRPAVKAATTADLGGVYTNGVNDDGVGATLNLGALEILDIDGITDWSQFNSILVKNQAAPLQNGRYYVSQVGDELTEWILTRCGTCDQSDEIPASYMFVQYGTVNAGKGFVALVGVDQGTSPTDFEIGYDSITFTQFSGGTAYNAGSGLELSDTTFNAKVDNTSIVVNGSNQLAVSESVATTSYVDSTVASRSNGLLRIRTFTASGTWIKQADVAKIFVYATGGGGGGGRASSLFAGGSAAGGGGGATEFTLVDSPAATYTVTIGAGGAGSTSDTGTGGTGGSTTVAGLLTAVGGSGGPSSQNSLASYRGGRGGSGDIPGQDGYPAMLYSEVKPAGNGGNSYFGRGGTGGNASAGTVGLRGGGGGGSSGDGVSGVSGGNGYVIIYEYGG